MASVKTFRGQYFSMDAIVASVIFVLALSLLMSHFFALRAQNDSHSSYLMDDAYRISTMLLGPGDPSDWYKEPGLAKTAGFGPINSSRIGVLNLSAVQDAPVFLDAALEPTRYDMARALFVTPGEFYIVINTSVLNSPDSDKLFRIGREPLPSLNPKEIVQVRRGVMIPETIGSDTTYHYGTLTLTLWMNKSRI